MSQVPFVAMCQHGHLQDFPWREWAHGQIGPTCTGTLQLKSTGGLNLTTMSVKCSCGASRSMSNVFSEQTLTALVDKREDVLYPCQGKRPWLGTDEGEPCGENLWAVLRNASNVYYPIVKSALYIPGENAAETEELIGWLQNPTVFALRENIKEVLTPMKQAGTIKSAYPKNFENHTIERIEWALKTIDARDDGEGPKEEENTEAWLRQDEYRVLTTETRLPDLQIRHSPLSQYDAKRFNVESFFSNIWLVEKLKETRVFCGFNRIYNDRELTQEERRAQLWRNPPNPEADWLPANVVYGEGLFIEFNEQKLSSWEERKDVRTRIQPLINQYNMLVENRRMQEKYITPRFVLLHTFAHLLINMLTLECGYSASSLRERLYVSNDPEHPMGGVLIYTAAGDSDGTLGGLVRMGKPGYLEPILQKAMNHAGWCSTDPVCSEVGTQGPDSSNLAACHNCALLPETSCEEFNRFLDRIVAVGDIGYFMH